MYLVRYDTEKHGQKDATFSASDKGALERRLMWLCARKMDAMILDTSTGRTIGHVYGDIDQWAYEPLNT